MASEDLVYQTAFTFANMVELEKAILSGTKRVKYSDKEIEYRSLAEMASILRLMRRTLVPGKKGSGLFGGKRIIATHSKGLDKGGTVRECFNGYGDDGDI